MAIAPQCDKCGTELADYGALVLSPPNTQSEVKKLHICKACYSQIEALIAEG